MKIPIEIIELESNSYHLLVTCEVNGSKKGVLVIDTGASKTVLDKNFVDEYQLTEENDIETKSRGLGEGSIVTEIATIKRFVMGDLEVNDFTCALIDLSGINEMYEQYCQRRICGLLGSDFLLKYGAVIDYKKCILDLDVESDIMKD
jgi:hypothetical protein